jgi:hypothetical protein
MRRLLLFLLPVLAAGTFGIADAARDASFKKTPVCDLTSAKTYKRVVATTAKALKQYTAKPEDIVPAAGACPKGLLSADAGGVAITATLLGVEELPNPGDPDGTGLATLHLRAGQGQICESIAVKNLGTPTASHIHQGTADDSGPVVVALKTPSTSAPVTGCVAAPRSVVAGILANRGGYYINVHTSDFPDGAIRAGLNGPQANILEANMAGTNEKPTVGDTDGTGFGAFILRPDKSQICYTLAATNIILPASASHIHRGDSTVAGPVIIPFTAPNAQGMSSQCTTADGGLLRDIIGNPGGFYANIHTSDFPGGAIRAPLQVVT